MLRRECHEQPRQWHRFINPLLFAYREARQEATGFSTFELLYGRTLKGLVHILKELWSEEEEIPEVTTSYQEEEIRQRLDGTMKLAHAVIEKNQRRNKNLYNRKAKKRSLQVGDKVLVLLPTDQNKLLMQRKVPYEIKGTKWGSNYHVEVNKKVKTYPINMLKLNVEQGRIEETATPGRRDISGEPRGEIQVGCGCVHGGHSQAAAVGQVEINLVGVKRDVAEEVSVNEENLLGLVTFQSKESIQDVCVGTELNGKQRNEVIEVVRKYEEIFTEIPGSASVIEHKIDLTDDRPIRCKPYPLPYAKRGEIREEIKNMMNTGIVRESSSPYASPLVAVKKKDGSNRMYVDN